MSLDTGLLGQGSDPTEYSIDNVCFCAGACQVVKKMIIFADLAHVFEPRVASAHIKRTVLPGCCVTEISVLLLVC